MPKVYLLSRTLDPVLGIFTGVLAYYLSETNPRSNIPPGHTLRDLIPWQMDQWKMERRAKEAAAATMNGAKSGAVQEDQDVDWERIQRELVGDKSTTR